MTTEITILCIGIDVEARAIGFGSNMDYDVRSLAEVGLCVESFAVDVTTKTMRSLNDRCKYAVVFPDHCENPKDWETQPGTSAEFWAKPEIQPVMESLVARGHVYREDDNECDKVVAFIDEQVERVKPAKIVFCTDTDMFDRAFLSAVFVKAGREPLLYGRGYKHQFYRIVDFSNYSKLLRLHFPDKYAAYKAATDGKFNHNHQADSDAEAHLVRTVALLQVTDWVDML